MGRHHDGHRRDSPTGRIRRREPYHAVGGRQLPRHAGGQPDWGGDQARRRHRQRAVGVTDPQGSQRQRHRAHRPGPHRRRFRFPSGAQRQRAQDVRRHVWRRITRQREHVRLRGARRGRCGAHQRQHADGSQRVRHRRLPASHLFGPDDARLQHRAQSDQHAAHGQRPPAGGSGAGAAHLVLQPSGGPHARRPAWRVRGRFPVDDRRRRVRRLDEGAVQQPRRHAARAAGGSCGVARRVGAHAGRRSHPCGGVSDEGDAHPFGGLVPHRCHVRTDRPRLVACRCGEDRQRGRFAGHSAFHQRRSGLPRL